MNPFGYLTNEQWVYEIMKNAGVTGAIGDELEIITKLPRATINSCVGRLREKGLIEHTGVMRNTHTGTPARVWVVVKKEPRVFPSIDAAITAHIAARQEAGYAKTTIGGIESILRTTLRGEPATLEEALKSLADRGPPSADSAKNYASHIITFYRWLDGESLKNQNVKENKGADSPEIVTEPAPVPVPEKKVDLPPVKREKSAYEAQCALAQELRKMPPQVKAEFDRLTAVVQRARRDNWTAFSRDSALYMLMYLYVAITED